MNIQPDNPKPITSGGVTRYIKNGKLHNTEGPAVIYADGKVEYYLNGFKFSKEDFKKRKREGTGLPFYKQSGSKMRH